MRLSRTDLLPVMVIIGGGAVGVLASGSLLLSSRAAHVPAPLPFVVPPATDGPARLLEPRLEEGRGEPLIYIIVKEDAAIARFGEEASGDAMQIWVKHESPESAEPDLSAEPTFTPFTVAPSILNRQEVVRAMEREYPPLLRDAGIGGQVVLYFFIDEEGVVRNFRIEESSGHEALDDAALAVAGVYRFSAALNRDEKVPVWVQFPVTFQVR